MTEQEAISYLHSLGRLGPAAGLARITRLMELLGNPQKELRFVHVAGTNGKGSTCAMTASILRKAGYRTGLYISPYIVTFRERIQLDGEMIPPEELAWAVERVQAAAEQMRAEGTPPVEFEAVTATALLWYAKAKADVVVLEVGLGGRFDATNVIPCTLCTVITPIGLDHTELLGDTLAAIAGEKCGIIKEGGVTVTATQDPEALAVIMETCARRGNPLISGNRQAVRVLGEDFTGTRLQYGELELTLPLLGDYQVDNCVTAVETARLLNRRGLTVPDQAIVEGIAAVRWPARMELLQQEPFVLLDGAHNQAGAEALARSLTRLGAGKATMICGMLADKDWHGAVSRFLPFAQELLAVTPQSPRALPAEKLAAFAREEGVPARPCADGREAWRLAREKGTPVIICGSLYLAAELREVVLTDLQKSK